MIPWLALGIFLLSAGDDVLAVYYVRRVNRPGLRARLQASVVSGLLTAMICLEVLVYTEAWVYLIPNALGSILGTYVAMLVDDRWPPPKARDEKGRYKKPAITPKAIVEVKRGM